MPPAGDKIENAKVAPAEANTLALSYQREHIGDTAVLKYRPTKTLPLLSAMLLDFAGSLPTVLPGLAATPAQNFQETGG